MFREAPAASLRRTVNSWRREAVEQLDARLHVLREKREALARLIQDGDIRRITEQKNLRPPSAPERSER